MTRQILLALLYVSLAVGSWWMVRAGVEAMFDVRPTLPGRRPQDAQLLLPAGDPAGLAGSSHGQPGSLFPRVIR